MTQHNIISNNPVRFGDRLANSTAFKTLFKEGMDLVAETATYLDGKGREDARQLPRLAALSYASESMRLTTRLMQIASWLLLQRAVNEGEMTQAEAYSDKRRSQIATQALGDKGRAAGDLPAPLLSLIAASLRLQQRVVRWEAVIASSTLEEPTASPQPLDALRDRLHQAFPGSV